MQRTQHIFGSPESKWKVETQELHMYGKKILSSLLF